MKKHWLMAIAAAVVVLLLLAGSFWLGNHVKSVSSASSSTTRPALLTGTVKLSVMATSVTVSATVVDSNAFPVTLAPNSIANVSPIVTAPGPAIGTVLQRGSVIAQVAEMPTFAFVGVSPMYRSISPQDSGQDVLEIQQNLEAMGYHITDQPGVYGPSTQTAVADFCHSSLNKIQPVDDSECPSASSPNGFTIPQSAIVFVPHLPATVQDDHEVLGSPVSGTALTIEWGEELLQGDLEPGEAGLVHAGSPVTINLVVNDQDEQYPGVISSVGTCDTSSSTASTGDCVFVKSSQPLGPADLGTSGAVTVVSQPVSHPVMVVPIAAVYAGPDGLARITVISKEAKYAVSFTPGPSIGGQVEIVRPSRNLRPGERVVLY
jgi:peptidoglycan hydrolase-like protein with peptidoglycan-binding domain